MSMEQASKGGQCTLSFTEMCEVAFDKTKCHKVLARSYHVSPAVIPRVKSLVAHALVQKQLQQLEHIAGRCEETRPDWAIVAVGWDETSERVTLPTPDIANFTQARLARKVLVSRMRLAWSVAGTAFHAEVLLPPVPLISNKAEHIFAGLTKHPLTAPIVAQVERILRAAKVSARISETDGHPANDRLHAFLKHKAEEWAFGHFRMPTPPPCA